ncbi:MAG: DNA-formamidopyrimidine glycosylase family protein [Acidobacteriaceae bacterium]
MPEGDTIFRAARTLDRALAGRTVTAFESALPRLNRVEEDHPIAGRQMVAVSARGKWMVMEFTGDLFLLTHMRMNGSWHVYRPGEAWKRSRYHMRVAIHTDEFVAVGFDVPVAEFHTAASLARHPGYGRLGEDVLSAEFNERSAIKQLESRPDLQVGDALLLQGLMAGIGNVFKSEICFACGVHPFRLTGGLLAEELACLVHTARKYLLANVSESASSASRATTGRINPAEQLWVYQRKGRACLRCGTPIQAEKQGSGARSTFWCPRCQPIQG